MPRSRRFAAVAVLALLGALALTGCGRAQPDVAAYVGNTRYTERQLDDLVDEYGKARPEARPAEPRPVALINLIIRDLARRAGEEHGIEIEPGPAEYNEIARATGLPADSKLVRMLTEVSAAVEALTASAEATAPTEDDVREIWDVLRRDPAFDPDVTYERVAELLRSNPASAAAAFGTRKLLREQAAKTEVVVNPVYRPLIAYARFGDTQIPMLLGEDADFVADVASG